MFSAIFFIFLTSLLIFAHWNIFNSDPLLKYDDSYVVAPLEKINSISDYVENFKAHKIYDVQPVRDLSFWIDYRIQSYTSWHIHHWVNLIVWTGILFLFFKLMLLYEVPLIVNYALVSLYAFHPALTNALVWVTARKHLLSTLFILWASYLIVKKTQEALRPRDVLLILGLYILSCLSQPINLLWPLWVGVYWWVNTEKKIHLFQDKIKVILLSLLLLVFAAVAIINQTYYSSTFVSQSDNLKFVAAESNQLSFRLLLFGRSVWQALVPYWSTPLYYYPGSILNIFGIILTSVVGWLLLRKRKAHYLAWFLFAVLPILVITINLTVVFGSDTYIINSVVGFFLCFALLAKEFCFIFEKKIIRTSFCAFFVLLFVSFLFQAKEVGHAWESDLAQTTRAVKVESSPVVLNFHIQNLLKALDYQAAFTYSQLLQEWDHGFKNIDQLYSSSLYHHPHMKTEDKIKLLTDQLKNYPQSPWIKYYLASLYASGANYSDALTLMETISPQEFALFKLDSSVIAAEFGFFHQKAKADKAKFHKKIEQIKSALGKNWNQSLFESRTRELLVN